MPLVVQFINLNNVKRFRWVAKILQKRKTSIATRSCIVSLFCVKSNERDTISSQYHIFVIVSSSSIFLSFPSQLTYMLIPSKLGDSYFYCAPFDTRTHFFMFARTHRSSKLGRTHVDTNNMLSLLLLISVPIVKYGEYEIRGNNKYLDKMSCFAIMFSHSKNITKCHFVTFASGKESLKSDTKLFSYSVNFMNDCPIAMRDPSGVSKENFVKWRNRINGHCCLSFS